MVPDDPPATVHFRACNLCEAICGLAIEVRDGEIISIRGDRDDPFSRGHICPKAVALQDIHNDPDRLRRPMRRNGNGWQTIGWDEAFDEVAARIRAVQTAHGRDAVAVYLGNPNVHNWGSMLFGPALIRSLRTVNRFSATSVDQLPHHVAAALMFGHKMLLPVPDIDRTSYLLVLGANPVVSNGSMMTAPGFKRRLEELRQRGGQLVVVDPRRTETASMADRHHFIRPGTDALLLVALLHVIFDERLEDLGHLDGAVASLETVRGVVRGFNPEDVAPATGIAAADIRAMARDFAAAPSAVCYGRMGVSTQAFGGLCQWLVKVLNIVTGNLDRPGGAMFTRPAVDLVATTGRGRLGRAKEPRPRSAGVRRRAAGGGAGRGDPDPGGGSDQGAGHGRRKPGAVDAQRGAARPGLPGARFHGRGRLLPQRDHAACPPHPAPDLGPRARPLRSRVQPAGGSQRGPVFTGVVRTRARRPPRLADSERAPPASRR